MSVGAHILLIVSISKDALIKWGIIIEGPLPSNCSYSMSWRVSPSCTRSPSSFDYAVKLQVWKPGDTVGWLSLLSMQRLSRLWRV